MAEVVENVVDLDSQYLTFVLDKQIMAIPLGDVEQIVSVLDITPIPETPPYFVGVIDLRGSVVPVIDLRLRFGKEAAPYTEKTSFIICRVDNTLVGCVVDHVEDVMSVTAKQRSAMPSVGVTQCGEFATGIARVETDTEVKMVLLLDTNRLVKDEDVESILGVAE